MQMFYLILSDLFWIISFLAFSSAMASLFSWNSSLIGKGFQTDSNKEVLAEAELVYWTKALNQNNFCDFVKKTTTCLNPGLGNCFDPRWLFSSS